MRCGYFDNEAKEYVITRPDTPTPWINYLGDGTFSGIISNNAGGLLFDGDPGNRRLTRYRYNTLPMDRPGRYLYIRDMETGEYWSPTWQPVLKELDFYECRHGLGYTVIKSSYRGIETEIKYYIPEGKSYELWNCTLKNTTARPRKLKLFSYMEFSYYNASVDIAAEWARYTMTAKCEDGIIQFDAVDDNVICGNLYGFMATTLEKDGFDCARDIFLGKYRSEQNPIAVERGQCSQSHINADNACGSLSCPMELQGEEEKRFLFTVGACRDSAQIADLAKEALERDRADRALAELKAGWQRYLECCQVKTPDEEMNTMLNIWHAYQCRTTFHWSRFISYYERGVVRGWGFRDSMQDVLGVMHAMAPAAKERIKTLLKIQASNGNARNVYYPGTGKSEGGGRSDDHLWSVFSVCTYLREMGDYAFLEERIPYADSGEGTVLEHLIRGLEFTRENVGEHGIPKFLKSDWNDSIYSIGKGGKAESVFVFFQAAHAAYELIQLFRKTGDAAHLSWAEEYYEWCRSKYKQLWDGKWFLRAYTDKGEKYGTDEDAYNKIFLNPQSWAVLSRLPDAKEGNTAFDEVYRRLFCSFGLISHAPASGGYDPDQKCYFGCPAGIKENGGVFYHANTWAVIAETILGRNEEAYEIYRASLPIRRNDIAERTLIEPYVYASAMLGPAHERYGAASNSWLTGTASWMYFAATQYVLGFRPDYDGLVIDPCIPQEWDGFEMTREYRGIVCHLKVGKLPAKNARAKALRIDGERIEGTFLPFEKMRGKKQIEIIAEF